MTEETIFAAALEKKSPAERAAYLDEVCAGDLALRRQVEALLEAHATAGDFLAVQAAEQFAAACRPPGEATQAIGASAPADPAEDPEAVQGEKPGGAAGEHPLDFLDPPHTRGRRPRRHGRGAQGL